MQRTGRAFRPSYKTIVAAALPLRDVVGAAEAATLAAAALKSIAPPGAPTLLDCEPMFSDDPAALVRKLAELKLEHRDLDDAIARLREAPACDELQLTRMKKRKLKLKDMITWVESRLIPDLDA